MQFILWNRYQAISTIVLSIWGGDSLDGNMTYMQSIQLIATGKYPHSWNCNM